MLVLLLVALGLCERRQRRRREGEARCGSGRAGKGSRHTSGAHLSTFRRRPAAQLRDARTEGQVIPQTRNCGDGTPGGEALTELLSLLARSLRAVLAAREELVRAGREPLTAPVLLLVVARTEPARRSVSGHAPRHPGPQHIALAAELAEARRLLPYPARRARERLGRRMDWSGRGVGQARRPDIALRAVPGGRPCCPPGHSRLWQPSPRTWSVNA